MCYDAIQSVVLKERVPTPKEPQCFEREGGLISIFRFVLAVSIEFKFGKRKQNKEGREYSNVGDDGWAYPSSS